MSKRWTQEDINKLKKSPSKTKLPAPKANDLTKAALRMLDMLGFEVWRQNNAGVYNNKGGFWRQNSSTPGIPDIIGYRRSNGQFIGCEIKAGKDRLSDVQTEFINKLKRAGGIVEVVRTMDDVAGLSKYKS